jgi:hypothetical protein
MEMKEMIEMHPVSIQLGVPRQALISLVAELIAALLTHDHLHARVRA